MRVLRQDSSRPGSRLTAATGLASGEEATPQLAVAAVREALERSGHECANSILLLLTADFARNAQAAVSAASRAGSCLQVAGGTVPGVFTESDWLIDRPGAAALVLCGDLGLRPPRAGETVISLAQPAAAAPGWLAADVPRCGGLATDGGAHQPGKVWSHSKLCPEGQFSLGVYGATARTGVSRGVRILSEPADAVVRGYELHRLGGRPALETLLRELPPDLRDTDGLPLHLLYAGVVDADAGDDAIAAGRYALVPLLGANAEFGSLTLAAQAAGARIFWAARQAPAAEQDMGDTLARLAPAGSLEPSFATMFSCMGRGPYFYGGVDRDLELVHERFPGMPLLGAYCAGEIAPLPSGNALIHNSVVLTLFDADVQSQP